MAGAGEGSTATDAPWPLSFCDVIEIEPKVVETRHIGEQRRLREMLDVQRPALAPIPDFEQAGGELQMGHHQKIGAGMSEAPPVLSPEGAGTEAGELSLPASTRLSGMCQVPMGGMRLTGLATGAELPMPKGMMTPSEPTDLSGVEPTQSPLGPQLTPVLLPWSMQVVSVGESTSSLPGPTHAARTWACVPLNLTIAALARSTVTNRVSIAAAPAMISFLFILIGISTVGLAFREASPTAKLRMPWRFDGRAHRSMGRTRFFRGGFRSGEQADWHRLPAAARGLPDASFRSCRRCDADAT